MKYLFVGNRDKTLDFMYRNLKEVEFFVYENSYAMFHCDLNHIPCKVFDKKKQLLEMISNAEFDVLVSSGCPFIIPVSKIKKEHQTFINIHPSLLPDLKGAHPITGAILFNRPVGVTCHLMDDGVDTGEVISQEFVTIYSSDIRLELLFRLALDAEVKVLEKAISKDFKPMIIQPPDRGSIYYTRKPGDEVVNIEEGYSKIYKTLSAFNIKGQYATLIVGNRKFKAKEVRKIRLPMKVDKPYEISYEFDDFLVIGHIGEWLQIDIVEEIFE